MADEALSAFRKKQPDHGDRANEATKIIERYLKTLPTDVNKAVLLFKLQQSGIDQPRAAKEIYQAAINHLDRKPEPPSLRRLRPGQPL